MNISIYRKKVKRLTWERSFLNAKYTLSSLPSPQNPKMAWLVDTTLQVNQLCYLLCVVQHAY